MRVLTDDSGKLVARAQQKIVYGERINPNPAERLIRRFGGQTELARLPGRRQSTVEHCAATGRIQEVYLGTARAGG